MFVLIATLIADSMINTGADSISQELASNWGVALFYRHRGYLSSRSVFYLGLC
jgi:hypothetical protein